MNVTLLGLLIIGLAASVTSHPTNQQPNTDDYQGDDYNDYNDENNDENQADELSSAPPPSVDVTEYQEKVHVNDNVILHCDVKNLGASSIIWYNGTQLLAHGKHANSDDRISVTKSLGLEIKNVTVHDAGLYICKILPTKLEIRATLVVDRTPKLVKIVYDNRDVTQKTVTFDPKKGEHELAIKCLVDGSVKEPKMKIIWTFEGKPLNALAKDDIAIEDHSLTLLKPSHHNSGVYHCVADEKTGKPQAFVTIHVKHQPIFPKHRDYVNTAVGNTAELHCDFTADPQPSSVRWFTNDRTRVHANGKYDIVGTVHGHHNRSTLVVKNVEKSDLSAYHCEVENSLGRASEKVTLGLQPAPALFEKFDYKRDQVTAVWLVKSIQPLLEMQVLYKQKNSSWKSSPASAVDASQCTSGTCRIVGTMELPPGEWTVAARSKNTEGWSHSDSSLHTLRIPEDFEITNGTNKLHQMSLLTILIFTLTRFF